MVWIAMHSNVELVTDDYYAKELKYQDHIEAVKNSHNLAKQVTVTWHERTAIVEFPRITSAKNYSGEIFFYRPSNKSADFQLPIRIDSSYIQEISLNQNQRGMWKVKIFWQGGNEKFYHEQSLLFQ